MSVSDFTIWHPLAAVQVGSRYQEVLQSSILYNNTTPTKQQHEQSTGLLLLHPLKMKGNHLIDQCSASRIDGFDLIVIRLK